MIIMRGRAVALCCVSTLVLSGTALSQYGPQEWFAAGSSPEHYKMGPDQTVKRKGEPSLAKRHAKAGE
jgi:hypothetical protein